MFVYRAIQWLRFILICENKQYQHHLLICSFKDISKRDIEHTRSLTHTHSSHRNCIRFVQAVIELTVSIWIDRDGLCCSLFFYLALLAVIRSETVRYEFSIYFDYRFIHCDWKHTDKKTKFTSTKILESISFSFIIFGIIRHKHEFQLAIRFTPYTKYRWHLWL